MADTGASGMDGQTFDAALDRLHRYDCERMIPAEGEVIEIKDVFDTIFAEMRDMGLFAPNTPEEYGGAGLNLSQYIRTVRELGWPAPAFSVALSTNTGMFTTTPNKGGTREQRAEWMARSANVEVACFGFTEPDSGLDAAALQTKVARDVGGDYILSGIKHYIINAPFAKLGLIMARASTDQMPRNAHISAFLLDMSTPGVSVGTVDRKMGQRGTLIADIIPHDFCIPAANLLDGQEEAGFAAAMRTLDSGPLSVGAALLELAERALEAGFRYAVERQAFGEPIAQFQLIRAKLADPRAETYAAECMMLDAAAHAERGRASLDYSAFKMFASEIRGRVVDCVVQIHDGAGYLAEYEAERLFHDARIYRNYEGMTQIQQLVIARHMITDFAGRA